MDVSDIITRLKAQCPTLKIVDEAMSMDDAAMRALSLPAAFVYLAGEQAETNMARATYAHKLIQSWCVVVAVSGIRSAKSSLTADLNSVRAEIRSALCGWSPAGKNASKMKFVGGEFVAREKSVAWWQDEFSCWTIEQ